MEAVRAYLETYLERTRARMQEVLSTDISALNALNLSILSRPGKMIRPALCLLAADIAGGVKELSIDVAAATELLHNATLMHDDVVDGAAQRRGLPTVMSMMGPAAAVLTGDYWLVKAVKCVLGSGESESILVRIFSKTLADLAEGEILQMQKSETLDTTEEDYLKIIYCKTASLFEVAALSGAISAGADEAAQKALSEFGRNAGIAFQIRDDILDYEGGPIGKPSHTDLKERKITLPLLCTPGAAELRGELGRGAIDTVYEAVSARGGIDLAYERIRVYVDAALRALDFFPPSEAKRLLIHLAEYTAKRKI